MKLVGQEALCQPNVEEIIIPRAQGAIQLIARGVIDDSSFHKLCPEPKPPQILKPGGVIVFNVEDPRFKIEQIAYANMRMDWMIIESLRATPGLEWEKVKFENPDTWKLWREELRDIGFSLIEVNRIHRGCMIANSLDESKIEEARKSFLALHMGQPSNGSFQKDGQVSTQSGEPVKDSESSPQV